MTAVAWDAWDRVRYSGLFRHGWEIAALVVAFVWFWPIGLLMLAYFSKRAGMWSFGCRQDRDRHHRRGWRQGGRHGSGNSAFDAYREETLKRLEEEQEAFQAFLAELRQAKDREEFDRFMASRRSQA